MDTIDKLFKKKNASVSKAQSTLKLCLSNRVTHATHTVQQYTAHQDKKLFQAYSHNTQWQYGRTF